MIQGLSTEDEIKIVSMLSHFSEISQALVFGSRAIGNYKQGSDVDIALKGQLKENTMPRLRGLLEELPLPYFFDLLDYDATENPALKEHIDQYGKIFYERAHNP